MRKIRKGDIVIVTTGASKKHVGEVLKVLKTKNGNHKVIVEGANVVKKAVKPNPNLQEPGGFVSKEAAISISNVAIYNPQSKRADKVVIQKINGKNVRYYRSTNDEIFDAVKETLAKKRNVE